MRSGIFLTALLFLPTSALVAQDAVKVDPDHYTVEFENDMVRVLRISYGPHEKSVMHEHPAGVAVILTDGQHWRFTLSDGTSREESGAPAGATIWADAEKHQPENLTDKRHEVILVELKMPPKNPSQ